MVQVGDTVQFRNLSKQLVTGKVLQITGNSIAYVDCNGIRESAWISDREFHVIDRVTGRHSQTPQYHAAEANAVAGGGCMWVVVILGAIAAFIYIMVTGSSPTDLVQ